MSNLTVIQSASDKRTYHPFLLNNRLECLVISDKHATKSAAALSINIGSFADPIETQGLAHYLQHMLFMGTGKYPLQNEYSNFLAKNAGADNAYTSLQETNYYFQIAHGAFLEALDRFSRFFIDPLMLDSSSERQLNAVHSEHSKNLQNDDRRKYHLSKHLAKPGHPYNQFSTGSKETLSSPNLREMLFAFYNGKYSSNLMKLVVYGQQDVETLTKEVQHIFSAVKDNSFSKFAVTQPPFDEKTLGKIIKITPVKDKRVLQLNWILSNQQEHYKNPPSRYVSHLLGHEGKGSLLSFLIAQGLATSLSASGQDKYDCFSQFSVSIVLTDKGLSSIKQIIGYVLYYINMLKQHSPQQWVVEQIKRVNKMKFDYLQKSQGMSFCSNLAKHLHKRKIDEVLVYPYFMEEFKPDTINAYLNQLSTENLIVYVEAKIYQAECTFQEPIYKTKYTIQPLGDVSALACAVTLPQHNLFIPDDLTVLPLGTEKHPRKLYSSQFIEAFFKEDHMFQLPKAQINLALYFDAQNSVKDEIKRFLFEKMLKQHLRQFTYTAQMAQLRSEFKFSNYFTFNIKILGFRDSFDRFITQYLRQILEFIPKDLQLFENLKQKQKKQYANYFLGNPYQIACSTVVNAMREGGRTSPQLKLKEIDSISLEDLTQFAKNWIKQLFMECNITGNLVQAQAEGITRQIEELASQNSTAIPKSHIGSIRSVLLPTAKTSAIEEVLKSAQETNSSLLVLYQHQTVTLRNVVLQELAKTFVKQPAFDYLRTKEQLGYIVMCLSDDHRGVLGLSILVQSNVKNSCQLQTYVSKFINEILKEKVQTLTEQTFLEYRSALETTKRQKDKNLISEASRFWSQILNHSYEFERKEKEIQDIQKITLEDFKRFLNGIFYNSPRVLQIHQVSQASVEKVGELRTQRQAAEQNYQVYSSVQLFRKTMLLYPDYYSHK